MVLTLFYLYPTSSIHCEKKTHFLQPYLNKLNSLLTIFELNYLESLDTSITTKFKGKNPVARGASIVKCNDGVCRLYWFKLYYVCTKYLMLL